MNLPNKNIEQYIIQYLEGTLLPTEKDWLLRAIEQNSYYRELFELYQQTVLSKQPISFSKKDLLKKDPQQYIINEWEDRCIRFIENELTPEEQNAFLQEIESDTEKRQVFEKYQHTKLFAQTNTDFISKNRLMKDPPLVNSFEELCIQSVENIIAESDKQILRQLIQSDVDNRKVFEQYSNTKLKPYSTPEYPYKQRLKKTSTKKTVWLYWTSAAAASIIVLFFWLTQKHETTYSFQARNNIYRQMFYKMPVNKQIEQPFSNTITTHRIFQNTTESVPSDFNESGQSVAQIPIVTVDSNTNAFIVEKPITISNSDSAQYDDKVLKESLDKLFANHRYHYFHEMIDQTANVNHQQYQASQGFSFWKILQKGSKYLNITGANVKVNEYQQSNRVKKEIAIGSLYFSTTSQK